MDKIRIGITGYGNLGKGVESGLEQNPDMELIAVFTRRDPGSIRIRSGNVPVCSYDKIGSFKDKIDVMILCGGSATDLIEQTPFVAKMFNTVDSFDTHARIPEFYNRVNEAALASKHVSIISVCVTSAFTFLGAAGVFGNVFALTLSLQLLVPPAFTALTL